MTPKKQLPTLKKGVSAKKAGAIKGGAKPKEGITTRNHNQVRLA
jgi:hypothetical protein